MKFKLWFKQFTFNAYFYAFFYKTPARPDQLASCVLIAFWFPVRAVADPTYVYDISAIQFSYGKWIWICKYPFPPSESTECCTYTLRILLHFQIFYFQPPGHVCIAYQPSIKISDFLIKQNIVKYIREHNRTPQFSEIFPIIIDSIRTVAFF